MEKLEQLTVTVHMVTLVKNEGVDPTEVPISATVNNRSTDALADVFTDGSAIPGSFYKNAGREYVANPNNFNFPGDGYGLNTRGNS